MNTYSPAPAPDLNSSGRLRRTDPPVAISTIALHKASSVSPSGKACTLHRPIGSLSGVQTVSASGNSPVWK